MHINLIAPINFLGYGVVGLNIAKALAKSNKVSLWPIGNAEAHPDNHGLIKELMTNALHFNRYGASLRIFHQNDMAMHVGSGKHTGFPIFELDTLTSIERHQLNTLDHIFVASKWAKQVLLDNQIGQDNGPHITVAPLGVDTSIFYPNPVLENDTTRFINIGKWEIRKGHDFTIDSFNKAFSSSDNVELWMMCDNPFLEDGGKQWINMCRTSKLSSKIKIIPRQATHENVYYIMSKADVGLFPARAEGWNLELLEMMAIGKQVICTNYSAHTEFADESNSHQIHITDKESAFDDIWFHNNGYWAHLGDDQQSQYVEHLRNLHKLKQEKNLRVNHAGIETGKKFTWENSAKKLIKILE